MKLKRLKSNSSELYLNDGTVVLFSYETPVAAEIKGRYYRTEKKWSRTTSKHITQWLSGRMSLTMPQSFFDSIIENV